MKPLNLIAILILVFSAFLPHSASAQTCVLADPCDEGRAYQMCMSAHQFSLGYKDGATSLKACAPVIQDANTKYFECAVTRVGTWQTDCYKPGTVTGHRNWYWNQSCAAKENLGAGLITFIGGDQGRICVGGCEFKRNGANTSTFDVEGFSSTISQVGGWSPSGATCTNLDPPPKSEPECVQGASQTLCVKPNGDMCASASNGKTFCWSPGDKGDKKDGNQYGTNGDNGPKAPDPEPKPSDNSDWKPPTQCTTVHERSGGGYTGRTHVVCTGTSTGNPNPPQCNPTTDPNCRPPQTGGCDPAKDPNQCRGGSASGGHGCDSPPSCSGDAINCAVLSQVWRSRCSANGNRVGGGTCTSNGTVPDFTCSGDEILCRQARIAAETQCRANNADANGNGRPDWTELDGSETPDPGDGEIPQLETITFGPSSLDTSGFLGATCPTIPQAMTGLFGAIKVTGDYWCQLLAGIRAITIALAIYLAFRILFG